MQYDLSRPIYEQVAMDLLKDILNGKLLPGEKLPSGRELALRYEINPILQREFIRKWSGENFALRSGGWERMLRKRKRK